MKKILFILPSLAMGGLERMQINLANKLQSIGYDVTVMILDKNRDLEHELHSSVTLHQKEYKKHLGKTIPYIRHVFYDDGMWETRATPTELYKYYVGKKRYDVEVAFFHGLCVKIISGSTNKDAVHLAWIHNDFRNIFSYRFQFQNHKAVLEAYKKFDRVVCVSDSARQGFIDTIGDTGNAITIYNMLPVEKIKRLSKEEISYRYPEKGLNLVTVGRLKNSHKGQLRLIAVVSRLKKEGHNISLTIVGDGEDRGIIERAIRQHHAGEYIFLTGMRSNPFPYIAGADVLVCSSYYEGFNLTVAEALILGVPVISTNCTGPNEILDHGKYGMLVENSRRGLYHGLKILAEKPLVVLRYRTKALQRIDFFSESRIIKQITDLFDKSQYSK